MKNSNSHTDFRDLLVRSEERAFRCVSPSQHRPGGGEQVTVTVT